MHEALSSIELLRPSSPWIGFDADVGADDARQAGEHDLAPALPAARTLVGLADEAHELPDMIAAELELSEKTVETHRSNAMRKMGAASAVELVRIVIEGRSDFR